MRNILIAVLAVFSLSSFAQQQKIGHLDVEALITIMPETKVAQEEIMAFQETLERDMKFLYDEYEALITEIQNGQANGWSELMLKVKEDDLRSAQEKIQMFQQSAQKDLVDKEIELMNPIIEKLQAAVSSVAKEKNFTYILDASKSKAVIIFKENGEDIAPLVKAKLGIQ